MKWSSFLSQKADAAAAVDECVRSLEKDWENDTRDLALVFASRRYAPHYDKIISDLFSSLGAKTLVGCSAGGVISNGKEVEQTPALNVVIASLPNASVIPFHLRVEDVPDLDGSPRSWEKTLGVASANRPDFLLLADPFTFPADDFVMGLDYAFPRGVKVGGLASGAESAGENKLFLNGNVHREGAVGAAFTGNVAIEAVVAQGCRPVGDTYTVTECRDNLLLGLEGKPPLEVLQGVAEDMSDRDRESARRALFIGMAMEPGKDRYERGDFLIRNIVGIDPEKGLMAVGALLRPGQKVQFHVRDAAASSEDLSTLLSRVADVKSKARGAVLFSCLGRGEHLYGEPDHDARLFQEHLGPLPLGGFFCNGEIGPVSGTTYLHGYTSCFGLFGPREKA